MEKIINRLIYTCEEESFYLFWLKVLAIGSIAEGSNLLITGMDYIWVC